MGANISSKIGLSLFILATFSGCDKSPEEPANSGQRPLILRLLAISSLLIVCSLIISRILKMLGVAWLLRLLMIQ